MSVLRLTSKLLAEIDDDQRSDEAAAPSSSPLGDWYGHLFTIERRKCVIFINEPTLFVCPALDIAKSECRQIVPFFKKTLAQTLRVMEFDDRAQEWIEGQVESMQLGRTTNRSTRGSLNNRIADTQFLVPWLGGLEICDIGEITRRLNETPMKPIRYSNGLEQMRKTVAKTIAASTTPVAPFPAL
jgi:hypothetical protein